MGQNGLEDEGYRAAEGNYTSADQSVQGTLCVETKLTNRNIYGTN